MSNLLRGGGSKGRKYLFTKGKFLVNPTVNTMSLQSDGSLLRSAGASEVFLQFPYVKSNEIMFVSYMATNLGFGYEGLRLGNGSYDLGYGWDVPNRKVCRCMYTDTIVKLFSSPYGATYRVYDIWTEKSGGGLTRLFNALQSIFGRRCFA